MQVKHDSKRIFTWKQSKVFLGIYFLLILNLFASQLIILDAQYQNVLYLDLVVCIVLRISFIIPKMYLASTKEFLLLIINLELAITWMNCIPSRMKPQLLAEASLSKLLVKNSVKKDVLNIDAYLLCYVFRLILSDVETSKYLKLNF